MLTMESNTAENSLPGGHLLIIVSKPNNDDHKECILKKVSKGLLSWDVSKTGCNLVGLKDAFSEERHTEDAEDFLIQYSKETLVVEVLLNPKVIVLKQCLKNLLSSSTTYKHIIHAGYSFTGSGSWILQDGIFTFKLFAEIFNDLGVHQMIAKSPECSVRVHCTPEGDWCEKNVIENLACISLNPPVVTSFLPGYQELLNYLKRRLISQSLEEIMKPSPVVGNIRFSRPSLYVFPGGDGDCALFGISGFNMLINGGFERKPCFWDFVRHIDRLDAMMITTVSENNLNGVTSLIKRKQKEHVFPHVGYVFCNITDSRDSPCDEVPKDEDELLVSLFEEGHEFLNNLWKLKLKPHLCFRENGTDPLTLYHKMGHGTLDMYVLNPSKNSREVKDFFQYWSSKKDSISGAKDILKLYNEIALPLSDLVSISVLLVWRPAKPTDFFTRILVTGNTPQTKIFEGLQTIKDLDMLQQFDCTESILQKRLADIPELTENGKKPVAKVFPKLNNSSPQKKVIHKSQMVTAKKDNLIVNKHTSERKIPDSVKVSTKKNIDSEKLDTKLRGKTSESNKDILSKPGTSTNRGKASQVSNIKNTVKPTPKFGKKTKGAKDVSNKKIAEKEIVDKNGKIETKIKRPDITTKLSHASKDTNEKTSISSPNPSGKSPTSKVVKQTQQTDMSVRKKVNDNLTSARTDKNSIILDNTADISLDTTTNKKDTKVMLDNSASFQHGTQDNKSDEDVISYSEKALLQPSGEQVEEYDDSLDSVSGNDVPLEELDEKTNIQEPTTGFDLTEVTHYGETLFSISDKNLGYNEEIHAGMSYDKKLGKTEKLQPVIGLNSSDMFPLCKEEMHVIQSEAEASQQELNENVQEKAQYKLLTENSCQLIIEDTIGITNQTPLSMDEKMFVCNSDAYPFLQEGSPLSEEQKSTFPISNFNFHCEENKNQRSSSNVYSNTDNSKLSENKDNQVEFDQRNTEDEIVDSLEMLVEEKAKKVKQEGIFPSDKSMELPKDYTHIPGNQLGVQSETHTSDRDYSASETLDAVSDDILPEDGTPGGETEKSFDQSFGEGFTDSSRENNMEIKEVINIDSAENKMVLKEDEVGLTNISLNKNDKKIQDKEYEMSDEDDGEIIRYPTPPDVQGFYEHIGSTSRLKEDHIDANSYILQYDIRTHPFQICEDLTVQPLYEESEEEDSERSASPVVEEPVYGNAMKADYPEMVNISESSTPSEPHSPLDSKHQVSEEKQNIYLVDHPFLLKGTGESVNDSPVTELEHKETEKAVDYLLDSGQQSIDQTCENTNVEDLCYQNASNDKNFDSKTTDIVTRDIIEQSSKRDEANYKGRDFVHEQSKHPSISCFQESCEGRYNQKETDQIANIDTMQYYSNNMCEQPASGDKNGVLETFSNNPSEEDKKLPNVGENNNLACDNFGDPNKSQILSERSYDVKGREVTDLDSSSGLYPLNKEQTYRKKFVSYGSGTIPSYQSFSSSTMIQDQNNCGEIQLSHDMTIKEPINFIRPDCSSPSSSYFSEHDNKFYDGGQASKNKHPRSSCYSEEEVGNLKDGVAYAPVLSQSNVSDSQNPTFNEFQTQELMSLTEESESNIHFKSLQLDMKGEEFHLEKWDKPMGLPTPPDSQNIAKRSKMPSKTVSNEPSKTPASNHSVKKGLPNGKNIPRNFVKVSSSRTEKTSLAGRSRDLVSSGLSRPLYVDLAYVPNHGDPNYCDEEFFKKIRARYYVFSGISLAKDTLDALLEAKKYWEDTDAEVTIVPTYETDVLGYWIALNGEMLAANKIEVAPSANRCIINLQDHETSCAAYRIEF